MGPTDLARPGWPAETEKLIADVLGGGRDKFPAAYVAASPLTYVRPGAPPVLTIHGTADHLVPYEQAQLLDAALRQAGSISLLETMTNKGHGLGWTPDDLQHTTSIIFEFTDRQLKQR